ncbi:MAG TPA: YdcF family protein [Pyrinomonadaceae bacterium]|nr:YdcF family protein [Pyrinomonadaceae bacterium]
MRWTRRRVRGAVVLGAILLVWPVVAWLAALGLITSASLEHADAIVVLSGSAVYIERARYAGKLYHEGRAPRVILTNDNMRGGWSQERQTNPFFIERARDELLAAGVPKERVQALPGTVESTFDEALAARSYAAQNHLRSLLFVTSAYHTRRTVWTLNKVFHDSGIVAGVESVQPGDQTPAPGTWWLHLRGWNSVALEYPKLIYYYWEYR